MPAPARASGPGRERPGCAGPLAVKRSLTAVTCSLVVRLTRDAASGRSATPGKGVRPTLTRGEGRCSVIELMFADGARSLPYGLVLVRVGRDPGRVVLTAVVRRLVVRGLRHVSG